MSSTGGFEERSYRQHSENLRQYGAGGKKEAHARTWLERDTVDAWRHTRMYQVLDPILRTDSNSTWLTVGDGRYGKDARYIMEKGCDAMASDISDSLLKEAKEVGYITDYRKENAESLSFRDSQFDYVFCKESYHHFPRPMLALYEMLRVAGKGVCLIEPNDAYINNKISEILLRNLKALAKIVLRMSTSKHSFEVSGNYVFSISRREIEKVALGMNFRIVAFKGINDAYFEGVEYEKLSERGPLRRKVRALILVSDLLCKLGLMDFRILAAIIFKEKPSEELLQQLAVAGYEIVHLPDNPYISA